MRRHFFIDLFHPLFYNKTIITYILKGLGIGDAINQHDPRSPLIIILCDGPEPLLPSSIPNLQSHLLTPNLYGFDPKIDANSGNIFVIKMLLTVPKKDVGFAYPAIPNDNNFENVVMLCFDESVSRHQFSKIIECIVYSNYI